MWTGGFGKVGLGRGRSAKAEGGFAFCFGSGEWYGGDAWRTRPGPEWGPRKRRRLLTAEIGLGTEEV